MLVRGEPFADEGCDLIDDEIVGAVEGNGVLFRSGEQGGVHGQVIAQLALRRNGAWITKGPTVELPATR